MKKIPLRIAIIVIFAWLLIGCMPEYTSPTGTTGGSTLTILAHPRAKGTQLFAFNIKESYMPGPNSATLGQARFTHLSGSGTTTKPITPGKKFRLLLRQVKMRGILASVCDTVIAFYPQPGTRYIVESSSDMDSLRAGRCSAHLYKIRNGRKTPVRPFEYKTLAN